MNPKEQDQIPAFELPAAQSSEQGDGVLPEQHQVASTEKQSSMAIEHGVSQQTGSSAPQQQTAPPQTPPVGQVTPQDDNSSPSVAASGGAPQIADDTDLIEKEWVIKAKEIVAKTSHDPHLQNKEMNKFKADYLKKRYNKEVKLSEDT